MTEQNGILQGQDTSSSPVAAAPAPAPVSSPSVSAQQQEKSFTQSEINDIVGRAKHEAVERYKRSSEPSAQPQIQSQQANSQSALSPDDFRRMAAEEVQRSWKEQRESEQRSAQEKDAERIAKEFFAKLSAGKEKYQDFDSVVGDIQFNAFPKVVQLAHGYVENTADVMYELGKDRIRMANLESLAERSPQDAIKQVQRFAQSIKDNATAANVKFPREPLSQLRPSNTGTDNGVLAVRDLRSKYRA